MPRPLSGKADAAMTWMLSVLRKGLIHAALERGVEVQISRFPNKERPHMPSSPTTPGRAGTRGGVPVRVAFRNAKSVGARDEVTFAAQ
jgi:hypothetical protein